ncbi:MAG: glycosyltransferase family 2 protein [Acidobacteria bacterium]|nr:glycosyltransferase family 2 protein [Acidobacteriota bacterium]
MAGRGVRCRPHIELSVVVPTFNEAENVGPLCDRLARTLCGTAWEVIFVDDDSPDGTAGTVRRLAQARPNIRCLHRIGRRGLSSACLEGALASSAPYIAVMDADLQHDETLLPSMLDVLRAGDVDIVIGSRYVDGGGTGAWNARRVRLSAQATRLARTLSGGTVTDPLSGFFMASATVWRASAPHLSAIGFKILLDILLPPPHRNLRVRELPYEFRNRERGISKLDAAVAWDFLLLLLAKQTAGKVPVRFLSFCIVGGLGVCVHLAVLGVGWSLRLPFLAVHAAATVTAMTSNFVLNNALTYRDKKLRGWRMAAGWLSFCLASSIGALGNVGVGYLMQTADHGWTVSATAGILIGTVWNYATTRVLTWRS